MDLTWTKSKPYQNYKMFQIIDKIDQNMDLKQVQEGVNFKPGLSLSPDPNLIQPWTKY